MITSGLSIPFRSPAPRPVLQGYPNLLPQMTNESMPQFHSPPMAKPTGGFRFLYYLIQAIVMVVVLSIFFFFASVAALVLIHLCIAGRAFRQRRRNLHLMYLPQGDDAVAGLSREELLALPCFVHPGSEAECAVCLEVLRAGDLCRALPGCNHEFHRTCVDRWLGTRPACPICRGGVAADGELTQAKTGWL